MANINNWLDILPINIERAVKFYNELITTELP